MQKVDLLEGSIVRSLTSLALPIMATSLIQMAYNMTDMIWIGRVSANAVAAVGAAGMYLWLANGLMGRRHSISGPCWWFCLQRFVSHSTGR